jgi:hypothetical protein
LKTPLIIGGFALHLLSALAFGAGANEWPVNIQANQVAEWTFKSKKVYHDPFNEIELDVQFTSPRGKKLHVPAFWAGGETWRVRYSSGELGIHRFSAECSDTGNPGLHGISGSIEIKPYIGTNVFYRHGPLRVSRDKKHFEHADGTPFLWLSDSWYMGLCRRLEWPEDFKSLTKDRAGKGFNVVQMVAGLYPDMSAFDDRGANEAGFPWQTNFARINPQYFDAADRRIQYLVDSSLSPCLFGAWGYYLPWMGQQRMKKHWRYLIARYGAYPVFWCLAGEATRPWYLSTETEEDKTRLIRGWTEVARYVREIDPYHRPLTIHPPIELGRQQVKEANLLDFEMLQTGHNDRGSVPFTINLLERSHASLPQMPVLDGEVCYEGILGCCGDDLQRYLVWRCLLSGTAGHSYGANGIWQINRRGEPFGASPGNNNWGNTPWNEAMRLPGSGQTGLARRVLERYEWWKFEPHLEWASQESPTASFTWGNWIWSPDAESAFLAPPGERFFRKPFEISSGQSIARALLHVAVDDNAEIFLNGMRVGAYIGWNPYREFDVTSLVSTGRNVIAVRAVNASFGFKTNNPAGLLVNVDVHFNDGGRKEIVSGSDWLCSTNEVSGWTQTNLNDHGWMSAKSVAKPGQGPWKRLTSPNIYLTPAVAGIPGKIRLIYLATKQPAKVEKLEPNTRYHATLINPQTGKSSTVGIVRPDLSNSWKVPERPAESRDWLLILKAE